MDRSYYISSLSDLTGTYYAKFPALYSYSAIRGARHDSLIHLITGPLCSPSVHPVSQRSVVSNFLPDHISQEINQFIVTVTLTAKRLLALKAFRCRPPLLTAALYFPAIQQFGFLVSSRVFQTDRSHEGITQRENAQSTTAVELLICVEDMLGKSFCFSPPLPVLCLSMQDDYPAKFWEVWSSGEMWEELQGGRRREHTQADTRVYMHVVTLAKTI